MLILISVIVPAIAGAVTVWLILQRGHPTPPVEDPWRTNPQYTGSVEIPVRILESIAKRVQLIELRRNKQDRLRDLSADIEDYGLQRPLTVVIDDQGTVCLKDGHGRLIVCTRIGYTHLPVVVKKADSKIRSHGRPAHEVLYLLLNHPRERGGTLVDAPGSGPGGAEKSHPGSIPGARTTTFLTARTPDGARVPVRDVRQHGEPPPAPRVAP